MDNEFHDDDNARGIVKHERTGELSGHEDSMYRALFEYAPDAIVIADHESYYVDANPSACKMLGYSREELVGLHASDIVTPSELEHIQPALNDIKAKIDYLREWQFRRKDGTVFSAEVMATVMPDGKLLGIIRDITERKHSELVATRLAAIVESSDDAIIGKDLNGIITSWNLGAERIFGYTAGEMVGTSVMRLIPADRQAEEDQILARLRRGDRLEHFETLRQTKDKQLIEVSITTSPIKDASGEIIGASKIARNIKVLKDRERQIARMSRLYSALSQCNQAILHCSGESELLPLICRDAVEFGGMKMAWIGKPDKSSGFILPAASFGSGTDYLDGIKISIDAEAPQGSGPIGTAFRTKTPIWCQDFQHDPMTAAWRVRAAKFDFNAAASLPLYCRGIVVGIFVLYSDAVNAFDDAAQHLLVEMAMDISFALDRFHNETERRQEQARLSYLANFDVLTGLPNRIMLDEHLKFALSLAKRSNGHFAVMFDDIDHFKNINDALGHSCGDALLVTIAQRIRTVLREEDMVARMGGDEFILILPDCDAQGAALVAQKLLQIVSEPYRIDQYDLNVTASIGIALYPDDGDDMESLSKSADTAMYRAKLEGRNGYRFFTTEMQALATRNLQLLNAMRHGLEQNQFHLNYQPQISIRDGRVIGVEALLRWSHPTLGQISPAEFIPIAEDCGLILPIGEWVLREAANQIKRWMDKGHKPIVVAVNLSAVQFRHASLPDMIGSILNEVRLPPEFLELELTEGVAMHDVFRAVAVMDKLHEQGVRMSIDDFGTGYSSLSYLKKFKVYKLKIDQSFVRDISSNLEDKAIVAAIISMSKNLGLQTIAEGVETANQLDYLCKEGCDEAQGYHISKPLTAEQMEAFIIGNQT